MKQKQDKVAEIKRLQAQIADIKAELSKYEEQLEDCKSYQSFLDRLTPLDWFESRERERARILAARMADWQAQCETVRKTKADAEAAKVRPSCLLAPAPAGPLFLVAAARRSVLRDGCHVERET